MSDGSFVFSNRRIYSKPSSSVYPIEICMLAKLIFASLSSVISFAVYSRLHVLYPCRSQDYRIRNMQPFVSLILVASR